MKRVITKSEKETLEFGKKFAQKLKGGGVIGLVGELGAGKTVFVKGLALGLGIKKHITSPTFVLMKVYPVKSRQGAGILPAAKLFNRVNSINSLIHIDAYRVKGTKEILDIGVGEYFNHKDTVVVIEWADKIKKILPKGTIFLKFKLGKREDEREITAK